MGFKQSIKSALLKSKKFIRKNGPTICTVVGCVGVAATGVLAWHGRAKCDEILAELDDDATIFDKVRKTAKAWGPVVGVGALSIGAIILSNGLSKKQIAALTLSNAMSTGAIMRTKEAIEMRADKIRNDISKLDGLPDEERRQGIFESDCDNFVYCLNPDGELYQDDFTGIWFRQLPEIVEHGYYAFNRDYAQDGSATLYQLYKHWGFGDSDWCPDKIKKEFKDIGWERYIAFDPNFDDGTKESSGEEFIDFREINGKMMRIFGYGNTVSDWHKEKTGSHTRITYLYVPHMMFNPSMSDDDFQAYMYNASWFGNRRFERDILVYGEF